jgi:hypothetical protein
VTLDQRHARLHEVREGIDRDHQVEARVDEWREVVSRAREQRDIIQAGARRASIARRDVDAGVACLAAPALKRPMPQPISTSRPAVTQRRVAAGLPLGPASRMADCRE